MHNTLEIIIASVPDRENLIAEIWHEEKMVAELSNEHGVISIEIYNDNHIKVTLEELLFVLKKAKKMLTSS